MVTNGIPVLSNYRKFRMTINGGCSCGETSTDTQTSTAGARLRVPGSSTARIRSMRSTTTMAAVILLASVAYFRLRSSHVGVDVFFCQHPSADVCWRVLAYAGAGRRCDSSGSFTARIRTMMPSTTPMAAAIREANKLVSEFVYCRE